MMVWPSPSFAGRDRRVVRHARGGYGARRSTRHRVGTWRRPAVGPKSFFEASDDRLRQALDAMPHKGWMVKPDGPALFYNRAMRAFAGAALDLPDRPAREKALIHPDDLGRVAVARD